MYARMKTMSLIPWLRLTTQPHMSGLYQREQALHREQGQTPLLSISPQVRVQELSTSGQ